MIGEQTEYSVENLEKVIKRAKGRDVLTAVLEEKVQMAMQDDDQQTLMYLFGVIWNAVLRDEMVDMKHQYAMNHGFGEMRKFVEQQNKKCEKGVLEVIEKGSDQLENRVGEDIIKELESI